MDDSCSEFEKIIDLLRHGIMCLEDIVYHELIEPGYPEASSRSFLDKALLCFNNAYTLSTRLGSLTEQNVSSAYFIFHNKIRDLSHILPSLERWYDYILNSPETPSYINDYRLVFKDTYQHCRETVSCLNLHLIKINNGHLPITFVPPSDQSAKFATLPELPEIPLDAIPVLKSLSIKLDLVDSINEFEDRSMSSNSEHTSTIETCVDKDIGVRSLSADITSDDNIEKILACFIEAFSISTYLSRSGEDNVPIDCFDLIFRIRDLIRQLSMVENWFNDIMTNSVKYNDDYKGAAEEAYNYCRNAVARLKAYLIDINSGSSDVILSPPDGPPIPTNFPVLPPKQYLKN
jgi:hypothetical protein